MTAPDRVPSVRRLIGSFETQAAARLDDAVYEFFREGAGDETALQEASAAWMSFRLLPRVLRDVTSIDTSVNLLGAQLPSPIGIAPLAYQGLLDVEAEVATVRGSGTHLSIVPTRSTRLLEDVAAASAGRPYGALWQGTAHGGDCLADLVHRQIACPSLRVPRELL